MYKVHTQKEDLKEDIVLSDNIGSRKAFAQALVISLDEDPDAVMQIWGQFSPNLQENCVVPIQHILQDLCELSEQQISWHKAFYSVRTWSTAG